MASADTAKLIASLELKDQFSKTVNKALGGLATLDKRIDLTKSKAFQTGQHIGIGIQNVARIGLATVSAGAGIVAASLKLAGDFEAQLNTINTIARATPTELKGIGDGVRKISKDTGTGLADLTQGYYDLLSAGIKVADAQGVLTAANTLAIGGLSTTAESVDLLTTALNVYGGGAAAATRDADLFAKAIEQGKTTAADLAASFSQVGAIAKSSGIEIEELTASYGLLTASGTDAAEASTQIRSAIVALTKQTAPLEKLQKATGKNYLAIAGKQGLVAALEIMRKDAAKAGVPLIDLLGRVEGLNFVLATTGPNFAKYNAGLAAMGNATGTAAAQMAERQKGLNFQLTTLKASLKDAGITIGSALLPKLTPLVAKLKEFVNLNTDKIAKFGDSIAGLFTDENITKGVDALKGAFQIAKDAAPAIAGAARITGQALKIAVDAFTSLPRELQTILVAGLAINKLTGGVVTNLAGGLIEAVVRRLVSAVVNVNGAVVNVVGGVGGVPGVVGAAGKGGGVLGALGKLALGVTVIGITAEAAIAIGKPFADALPPELKGPNGLGWSDSQRAQMIAREQFAPQAVGGGATAGLVSAIGKGVASALAFRAGKTKDDIVDLVQLAKATNAYLNDGFQSMVRALKGAKGDAAIRAAVKQAVETVVTGRRGNATATERVLSELKAQLGKTHDPKTAAILKDAIRQVEHKLVGRQLVQKQLDKAGQIFRSSESTKDKIRDLTSIQKGLAHTSRSGQAKIEAYLEKVRAAAKEAGRQAAAATRDKDFSITIPVTSQAFTYINGRKFTGTVNRQYLLVRAGQAANPS